MPEIPRVDEYGQKTLTVSWSRLHEWDLCQQKSAFHRAGKGTTIKEGRRFLHGTLADRAMRQWLEQDEPQLPGQMEAYIDDLWEEHAIKSPEYKIEWKGDPIADQERIRNIAKTVVRNVEPFLIARVLPFDYEPEFRFRFPVKIPDQFGNARTIGLNGGMDIAVVEPDRVSIYDLKATTNENYVHQGIMPQLIFYSIAWSYLFPKNKENVRAAFLTPACKVQYHELEITKQDKQYWMSKIIKFAHHVWSEQPPVCTSDNNVCYFCDCKSICPKFAAVLAPQVEGKHRVSFAATAEQRNKAKEESKNDSNK